MGEKLIDDLARALAEPMPRRRAVRLLGVTLVAVAVPGLRPGRAMARPKATCDLGCGPDVKCCPRLVNLAPVYDYSCGSPARRYKCVGDLYNPACEDTCAGPSEIPCKGKKDDDGCAEFHCCKKPAQCIDGECVPACPAGRVKCQGKCCPAGFKCCPPTREMPKGRCYDPDKQCCTPVAGVLAKRPIRTATDCPDRVAKPEHPPPRSGGCGPESGFRWYSRAFDDDLAVECVEHRQCYVTCRNPKSYCDRQFKRHMDKACRQQDLRDGDSDECLAASARYFKRVSEGGDEAYESAQKRACGSCC